MLVYIIDAFNLIYKVDSLLKADDPHSSLIHYIRNKKLTGSKKNKVIIVYDGGLNRQAQMISQDFEVVFGGGISADEIIKKRLAKLKNKRQVVVISDDRQVRDDTKAQGAVSLRINDFLRPKKHKSRDGDGSNEKNISESVQHEITEELRKIWLKE